MHLLKVYPNDLGPFLSYGLWNGISAYGKNAELISFFPAHDGDFFPTTPFDYIEQIKNSLRENKSQKKHFWPINADIDITLECNNQCTFCYTRKQTKTPLFSKARIDFDLLHDMIKCLVDGGTKSIRITGGGEPFAHPDIKKLCRVMANFYVKKCIFTNGSTLNHEISELLVKNFDHIRVSLNAATEKTRHILHRPIKNSNSLSDILDQLRHMVKIRSNTFPNEKKPLVWTTFLITPQNSDEILPIANITKDIGVDSISFRHIYRYLHDFTSKEGIEKIYADLKTVKSMSAPPDFSIFTPKRKLDESWETKPEETFEICFSCKMRTIIEASNAGPIVRVCGMYRGQPIDDSSIDSGVMGIISPANMFKDVWDKSVSSGVTDDRPNKCNRNCPTTASFNKTIHSIWNVLKQDPEAVFKRCLISED